MFASTATSLLDSSLSLLDILEILISLMTYCLPSSVDLTRMAFPNEPSPIFCTLMYFSMVLFLRHLNRYAVGPALAAPVRFPGSVGRTGRFGTAALPAVPSACGRSWAGCRGGVLAAGRSSFSPSWSMAAAVVPPEGDNQTAKWSLSSCSIEATVETATTV